MFYRFPPARRERTPFFLACRRRRFFFAGLRSGFRVFVCMCVFLCLSFTRVYVCMYVIVSLSLSLSLSFSDYKSRITLTSFVVVVVSSFPSSTTSCNSDYNTVALWRQRGAPRARRKEFYSWPRQHLDFDTRTRLLCL